MKLNANQLIVDPNSHTPIIPPDISAFRKIDSIVNKVYLSEISSYEITSCPKSIVEKEISDSICLFPISKFVYDRDESVQQKLTSVFSSAASAEINVAMLIRISHDKGVQIYLGVCNEENRENGALPHAKVLYNSFVGNFPGCRSSLKDPILNSTQTKAVINECFPSNYSALASVSAVASVRGTQKNEKNSYFFQGIEKTIEALQGTNCTILVLTKALTAMEIREIQEELEMLYTQLIPFAKASFSINQSLGNSVSKSLSESLSTSVSETKSHSISVGESTSHSEGNSSFNSDGFNAGVGLGKKDSPLSFSGGYFHSWGNGTSSSDTVGNSSSVADAVSNATSEAKTKAIVEGHTENTTDGQSIQISYENKTISEVLCQIEQQLKRLKTGVALGMFASATYFISDSLINAQIGANTYKAVISGDNTNLENAALNSWTGDRFKKIYPYISHLCHPSFVTDTLGKNTITTPAVIVSASELAIQMSIPKNSVQNIPVRESVSFGRSISSLNIQSNNREKIEFGKIYHLGCSETSIAELDVESLTMHTFATGTTGSGKSNTIYGLLNRLCLKSDGPHFLVIEPAKGEYKTVFGKRSDVTVYGTNPDITRLLRINPFRFDDKNVHVLEHIDRLISIFNVCWPMEAAMPAVLKQAIERAYETAGWDLRRSKNAITKSLFPNFEDVMGEVESIIDESAYSGDNKGDYKGALCTRLRELTTGLNSMIFVPNDLSDADLFDENVIVDLSRIGSAETKALIMGLLVIKLQEYRQAARKTTKTKLQHVTILEEAHHLLKRTSTQQSMDSANLVGKSVEMISNALAETRSSGEGFIIVDQSPEQMDLSVIRNTNTKIIMRLPSYEDRKLVGKAASLNDAQIDELAKLPTGVAAVYQNDWMEAVLVQIPYHEVNSAGWEDQPEEDQSLFTDADTESLLNAIMYKNGIETLADCLEPNPIDGIAKMKLSTKVKRQVIDYIRNGNQERLDRLGRVAFEFFNLPEVMLNASVESLAAWKEDVLSMLEPSVAGFDDWDKEMLLIIIGHEWVVRNRLFEPIYIDLCHGMV